MFKKALSLLVLSQIIGAVYSDFCKRDLSTLDQIIVVFRHGDRNPETTFPTDRWQEDSWPLGFGQLTPTGVFRHYIYGQWMRSCYGSFLNETLSTKNVHVRSTDIDRTLMSAQAHLTGAYPPKGYQIWGQPENITLGKMWQPFAVHTVPEKADSLMHANKNCVRFNELIEDAYNSQFVKDIEKQDDKLLTFLATNAGLNDSHLLTITRTMSDAVVVEMQNNRTLNEFLQNKTLTDKLVTYNNLWFQLSYNEPHLAKLAGGPLLQEIVDEMVNRSLADTVNAPPSFEHIVYSGHDSTVAVILSSLGDFNNIAPPYTATVMFELHKMTNGSYAVVVFYRNSTEGDPIPVKIANCTGFQDNGCLLPAFLNAVASRVTRTHATDCLSGRATPAPPLDLQTILIVVGVTVGLMVVTIALACLLKFLRRRPRDELLIEPGVN